MLEPEDMEESFEEAVLALAVGAVGRDVVETESGWHIVLRTGPGWPAEGAPAVAPAVAVALAMPALVAAPVPVVPPPVAAAAAAPAPPPMMTAVPVVGLAPTAPRPPAVAAPRAAAPAPPTPPMHDPHGLGRFLQPWGASPPAAAWVEPAASHTPAGTATGSELVGGLLARPITPDALIPPQVSHGLQLQSLWIIPAAAVS